MTDTIPEKRPRVTAREKAIRRMFSKETARDKMAETRTYVVEPRICKFTKEEDEQIVNAIRASIISMKKYGQGQKPRMVDMKHYDNTPAFLLPEYQGEMHEVRFSRVTSKNIIFVCASEFGGYCQWNALRAKIPIRHRRSTDGNVCDVPQPRNVAK